MSNHPTPENDRDPKTDHAAEAIARAAADWVAKRDRGLSAEEERAFSHWLAADEQHAAALESHEEAWMRLDALASAKIDFRPASAAAKPPASATTNSDEDAKRSPLKPKINKTAWLAWAGLAAMVALVIGGVVKNRIRVSPSVESVSYVSAVGERREIALADGSVVWLNTDSQVVVAYAPDSRDLKLLRGEAYFIVAKDQTRPFSVASDKLRVTAVGTEFNVASTPQRHQVLVAEGQVRVVAANTRASKEPSELVLSAGQSAAALADSMGAGEWQLRAATLSPEELARRLAWRAGKLEFAEATLAEVLAEFNRHHVKPITLADPALGQIRIAGSFRADNVEGLLRVLETSFQLRVEQRADAVLISRDK